MTKTLVVKAEEKDVDNLQSLNYDIETRLTVIDRLFSNHKDDVDNSIFESIIYKSYNEELKNAYKDYEIAKEKYGTNILRPIVEKETNEPGIDFNWDLNFITGEVTVTY